MAEERTWCDDEILVQVCQSHDCLWPSCRYKILKGSIAAKSNGCFRHYPHCPRSPEGNRRLVSIAVKGLVDNGFCKEEGDDEGNQNRGEADLLLRGLRVEAGQDAT